MTHARSFFRIYWNRNNFRRKVFCSLCFSSPGGFITMTRARIGGMLQALAAHLSLLCFSCLIIAKVTSYWHISWWWVFLPLWAFHGIVSRGRFSLPAPAPPHDRQWSPCHTVVAIPLLIAFELLLCCYLDSQEGAYGKPAVSLKVVFLPLLAFQATILIDNFRMCRALMPSDEESMTDEAIWETLPHFWVAVSMVFFMAATIFTLLKLSGDVEGLGWWDLFINFGIAECFSFLVCTKWSNSIIHQDPPQLGPGGLPIYNPHTLFRATPEGVDDGSTSRSDDDESGDGICGRQDIGGHLLKLPILLFQILLCMKLEGTPERARSIPVIVLFSPLLLVQAVAVCYALLRLLEQLWLMLPLSEPNSTRRLAYFAKGDDCCGFLHHGSRLLGWWSIDETSREEHARLFQAEATSYNTFSGFPPEVVKKMARKDLADEVWRLQAALGEQTEITKQQAQEYDRLQNDKVLCRVCFERDIAVVLIPCRHRILCSVCSEKCKHCPVCRNIIVERMPVFDV